MLRRFRLERVIDQSGISGTGTVLEGAVLPSGKCIVEWRSPYTSDTIFNSFDEFNKIHVLGHPGTAVIIWEDSVELQIADLNERVQKLDAKIAEFEAKISRAFPNPFRLCQSVKHPNNMSVRYCEDCQP